MRKINIVVWLLAPAIFLFTKNPLTGPWRILWAFLALVWFLVDAYFLAKGDRKRKFIDFTVFCLFLVGATNWFFSPFFFLLHLLVVGLTFVFLPSTGFGFVISLIILFIFNIGEVDVAYDSLVLLSLLGVFPIALYLRKEYLKLLKSQNPMLGEDQLEEKKATLEKGTAVQVPLELRNFLVNIENYAHILTFDKDLPPKKAYSYLRRLHNYAVAALKILDEMYGK